MHTWDFQGPLPEFLTSNGLPLTHAAFQTSADGLRISLLPGRDFKNEAVGFDSRLRLSGDFEVTASFSGLKATRSEQAKTYKVPGVDLLVALDQPGTETMRLERRHYEDADKGQAIKVSDSRVINGKTEWNTTNFPWNVPDGRLRLSRKGSTLFYLIAPGHSDDWRLLRERELAATDAVLVSLLARNFDPDSSVTVTLKDFTIRAERAVKP